MAIPHFKLFAFSALLLASCMAPHGTAEPHALASAKAVLTPMPASANAMMSGPPAACPVTRRPDIPFVPPAPYPAEPPSNYVGQFWYGTPELWTMLGDDGTWTSLPYSAAGYTQKLAWWRQGYNMYAEPMPDLTVTGKRINAPGPFLAAAHATNAEADFGEAMMIGIEIPSLGCWEITGHYHGHNLSFVIQVEP